MIRMKIIKRKIMLIKIIKINKNKLILMNIIIINNINNHSLNESQIGRFNARHSIILNIKCNNINEF